MGRSQRHLLDEHGATSAGEIHAQGVVADGIMMQVDPSRVGVMLRAEGSGVVDVPIGDPGGPLSGSSLTGAIPQSAPDPIGDAPRLTSLSPASADIQSGDVLVTITGTGFTEETVLVWNGVDDVCQFLNETTLTTTVKTDLSTIAVSCLVKVRNGDSVSNELIFELTGTMPEEEPAPPPAEPAERVLPLGPADIALIEDHPDGLAMTLVDAIDIRVGDVVRIEATFDGSVNGSYEVLGVAPDGVIIIDNDFALETPIENKGRLTIVE